MLKILGLKTKPTPKPEGWGKARGHEQGPEGRSRGVSSPSSWPQQPWDPRALAEKKVRTLKTPSAAPTGMRTHIHRAPRLAEICDTAPNTRGSYSHGDGDAREVDAPCLEGVPGSVLVCDRRTWEATGGRGLGHVPLLTAVRTRAVPKVSALLFHTVSPCLNSSVRLAASPLPSR